MADYTQAQAELLAHQELTHPATIVGSAVDVSTYLHGVAHIWQGNIETTANLAAGLDYIDLQGSPDASGNNWVSIRKVAASTTKSVDEAFTAIEPIAETVCAVAATEGFNASDLVYIKAAAGVSSSEWAEVASIVTDTSITLVDGLAVAKAIGDVFYDQASRWAVAVDLAGYQRLRVVVKHHGATGSDWRVKAVLEAATDIE
jgi:hypothetical protein